MEPFLAFSDGATPRADDGASFFDALVASESGAEASAPASAPASASAFAPSPALAAPAPPHDECAQPLARLLALLQLPPDAGLRAALVGAADALERQASELAALRQHVIDCAPVARKRQRTAGPASSATPSLSATPSSASEAASPLAASVSASAASARRRSRSSASEAAASAAAAAASAAAGVTSPGVKIEDEVRLRVLLPLAPLGGELVDLWGTTLPLAIVSREQRVIFGNEASRAFTGFSYDDLRQGLPVVSAIEAGSLVGAFERFGALVAGQVDAFMTLNKRFVRKTGDRAVVHMLCSPLRDAEGAVRAFLLLLFPLANPRFLLIDEADSRVPV